MNRVLRDWASGVVSLSVALAVFLGSGGCSSDTTTPKTMAVPAAPSALTYINGDGSVKLLWQHSPDHLGADFKGYYVYRDSTSMAGLSASNLEARRLNSAAITSDTVRVGVETERKYFFAVRAANQNGDLSAPTEEIDTAARPLFEGAILGEFRSSLPSGLQCRTGTAFRMIYTHKDDIDLYLGTVSVQDSLGTALALKSPHLVRGPNDWSQRVARLKLLGSSSADWDLGTTPNAGWADSVILGATSADALGKVIAVRTPLEQDGHYYYAKIRISAARQDGENGERSLEVKVAYQPIPEYIRFSRPR